MTDQLRDAAQAALDWFDAPGGDPDSSVIADMLRAALAARPQPDERDAEIERLKWMVSEARRLGVVFKLHGAYLKSRPTPTTKRSRERGDRDRGIHGDGCPPRGQCKGWCKCWCHYSDETVAESATPTEGPLARGLREDDQWDPRTVIDAGGNRGR